MRSRGRDEAIRTRREGEAEAEWPQTAFARRTMHIKNRLAAILQLAVAQLILPFFFMHFAAESCRVEKQKEFPLKSKVLVPQSQNNTNQDQQSLTLPSTTRITGAFPCDPEYKNTPADHFMLALPQLFVYVVQQLVLGWRSLQSSHSSPLLARSSSFSPPDRQSSSLSPIPSSTSSHTNRRTRQR